MAISTRRLWLLIGVIFADAEADLELFPLNGNWSWAYSLLIVGDIGDGARSHL